MDGLGNVLAQRLRRRFDEAVVGAEVHGHRVRPRGKLALSYLHVSNKPNACLDYASFGHISCSVGSVRGGV